MKKKLLSALVICALVFWVNGEANAIYIDKVVPWPTGTDYNFLVFDNYGNAISPETPLSDLDIAAGMSHGIENLNGTGLTLGLWDYHPRHLGVQYYYEVDFVLWEDGYYIWPGGPLPHGGWSNGFAEDYLQPVTVGVFVGRALYLASLYGPIYGAGHAVPEPSLMVLLGISIASVFGLKRWWRE